MKAARPLENAALRSRLHIRDFFLSNAVSVIYENIGQVMSLVKMDLQAAQLSGNNMEARLHNASQLIGQGIKDLRSMTRNFRPDADLILEDGFTKLTHLVVEMLYPDPIPIIELKGQAIPIPSETNFVFFSTMLEILEVQHQKEKACSSLYICFEQSELTVTIHFTDSDENPDSEAFLTLVKSCKRKLKQIHGHLDIQKEQGVRSIWKLSLPNIKKLL